MKRTLLTLLLGSLAGLVAHVGWLNYRKPAPAETLDAQLAWMKRDLQLSEEQVGRLRALHAESAPRLLALAAQAAAMRDELAAFERTRTTTGQIDFLEFARFVDQRRAFDQACLDSTRALVAASAQVMTPGQREHYLSLVSPSLRSERGSASP